MPVAAATVAVLWYDACLSSISILISPTVFFKERRQEHAETAHDVERGPSVGENDARRQRSGETSLPPPAICIQDWSSVSIDVSNDDDNSNDLQDSFSLDLESGSDSVVLSSECLARTSPAKTRLSSAWPTMPSLSYILLTENAPFTLHSTTVSTSAVPLCDNSAILPFRWIPALRSGPPLQALPAPPSSNSPSRSRKSTLRASRLPYPDLFDIDMYFSSFSSVESLQNILGRVSFGSDHSISSGIKAVAALVSSVSLPDTRRARSKQDGSPLRRVTMIMRQSVAFAPGMQAFNQKCFIIGDLAPMSENVLTSDSLDSDIEELLKEYDGEGDGTNWRIEALVTS